MEDFLYAEIGRRIREARENKKWTQQELSDKMELTRSSIANIELGRQKIQVHVLYRFSTVLGLSPFDLLPLDVSEKPSSISDTDNMDAESYAFLQRILNKSSRNGGEE